MLLALPCVGRGGQTELSRALVRVEHSGFAGFEFLRASRRYAGRVPLHQFKLISSTHSSATQLALGCSTSIRLEWVGWC